MNKVAHYLQEHLMGEVMDSADARKYFSTDASVLSITPNIVVYPRNENDVRKTTRFTWQLAERGRIVPITARGSGTDESGAALGSGVILAFPAHMNRIIELDNKSGQVIVEPGINYGKLQQALITHGRFLPPAPASMEFSTIGGAVANNASGDKTFKYGDTRFYVKGLKVVLANGELIETGPLNKRELNRKLGLATFEGEIYRALDTLLEENQSVLKNLELNISKNSAGFNLLGVKTKSGFDLTPLIVGSQGTLGIVSEVTLDTLPYNPSSTLAVGMFDDVSAAGQAVVELKALQNMPSSIEMIDSNLLEMMDRINPNQLKNSISRPFPKIVLLVDFDDPERASKRMAKKATKIFSRYATDHRIVEDENEQADLLKLRHAAASVLAHSEGTAKAVPFIEDAVVPTDRLSDLLNDLYDLLSKQHVKAAIWGHAGDGNIHLQPHLDLSQVGDRQKLFRLYEDYYDLVLNLGGSTTGENGDGRVRAPILAKVYGQDAYEMFEKVKQIFDPYNTLNPGVKLGTTLDDVKILLRQEYSMGPWFDHMPRS